MFCLFLCCNYPNKGNFMKLVTAAEMKVIEQAAEAAEVATEVLMRNAGTSVFEAVRALPRFQTDVTATTQPDLEDAAVVVLAGSGNNGGDAMYTAMLLRETFPQADINIYFYKRPRPDEAGNFSKKLTYTEAEQQEGLELTEVETFRDLEDALIDADLVIDGLLGAGLSRPVKGELAQVIQLVNAAHTQRKYEVFPLAVVAIDVPSGINSDTGDTMGGIAIEADLTVTLGFPKQGLFSYSASTYTGEIKIGDIGLPLSVVDAVEQQAQTEQALQLTSAAWMRRNLPSRPFQSNKGTFGKLMVVAGSADYLGAPYLTTSGGMRSGAGLVTLAAPRSVNTILATKMSENTFLNLPEIENEGAVAATVTLLTKKLAEGKYQVLVLGPGLGQEPQKMELMRELLALSQNKDFKWPKLVIDADGLNMLAQIPQWWEQLPTDNILTPHPGELASLCQTTIAAIEADRLKAAREAAELFKQVVILKGAYTVIAAPDGRTWLNPAGNPALATAGSGDVLAGITAGLLTQMVRQEQGDSFAAACIGVYLHAMAGELLRREYGDAGTLAGDLLLKIPLAIRAIKDGDGLEI
jgi:NAD(P)H-hydrate epimerase